MSYSDEIRKALDSDITPIAPTYTPTPIAPMSKEESISESLKRLSESLANIQFDPYRIGWLHHNQRKW